MTIGEPARHAVETFFVWASQQTVNLGPPSPPEALTRTDLASKGGGPSPPFLTLPHPYTDQIWGLQPPSSLRRPGAGVKTLLPGWEIC